jgi:hypothetical protein
MDDIVISKEKKDIEYARDDDELIKKLMYKKDPRKRK